MGGTSFVGRAMIETAGSRGHTVSALNRGSRPLPDSVVHVGADRNDAADVGAALRGRRFDAVIDVSAMAARQADISATALCGTADHYLLVSTVSVHTGFPREPVGPASPTVRADPDDPALPVLARYGEQKRGAELAVLRRFGDSRTTVLRPGFILGPHENVGRVDYWCGRVASGRPFIAPHQPDRSFQVADVRDLAEWSVRAVEGRIGGVFTASSPFGRDTWGSWLDELTRLAAGDQRVGTPGSPVWVPDERLLSDGVAPGSGLPLWIPGGAAAIDASAIESAGYSARPLRDTAQACWDWWGAAAEIENVTAGQRPPALDRESEQRILSAHGPS